jgi:hypothetical protein
MSYADAHTTLRQRFATSFAAARPGVPVAWGNVTCDPPATGPWVRFQIADYQARQASIGGLGRNLFRHPGDVFVHVQVPAGGGTSEALAIVDDVCAIFRNWQSGGITMGAPFVRQIGEREFDGARWFVVVCAIPFTRDELM